MNKCRQKYVIRQTRCGACPPLNNGVRNLRIKAREICMFFYHNNILYIPESNHEKFPYHTIIPYPYFHLISLEARISVMLFSIFLSNKKNIVYILGVSKSRTCGVVG
jgi:hypothetical protein